MKTLASPSATSFTDFLYSLQDNEVAAPALSRVHRGWPRRSRPVVNGASATFPVASGRTRAIRRSMRLFRRPPFQEKSN